MFLIQKMAGRSVEVCEQHVKWWEWLYLLWFSLNAFNRDGFSSLRWVWHRLPHTSAWAPRCDSQFCGNINSCCWCSKEVCALSRSNTHITCPSSSTVSWLPFNPGASSATAGAESGHFHTRLRQTGFTFTRNQSYFIPGCEWCSKMTTWK